MLYISRLESPEKKHTSGLSTFNMLPYELAGKYDIVMTGF